MCLQGAFVLLPETKTGKPRGLRQIYSMTDVEPMLTFQKGAAWAGNDQEK
jgi:hypothetical protein